MENSELYDLFNSPKSNLQYQLYKTTLRVEVLCESISDFAKRASESLVKLINPFSTFINEYKEVLCLGAKENPRVAYLARHAKKYRQRKKNFNRLYLIGLEIQKQNSHLK